jgi:hypothetical protein
MVKPSPIRPIVINLDIYCKQQKGKDASMIHPLALAGPVVLDLPDYKDLCNRLVETIRYDKDDSLAGLGGRTCSKNL